LAIVAGGGEKRGNGRECKWFGERLGLGSWVRIFPLSHKMRRWRKKTKVDQRETGLII
jgi:hypothetical protein